MTEAIYNRSIEATTKKHTDQLYQLIAEPLFVFEDSLRNKLPAKGGVYHIIDNDKQSIYIGKSDDLQRRIYQNHWRGSSRQSTLRRKLMLTYKDEIEVKQFLKEKCCVQFIEIEDEEQRTAFEHFAVAILGPTLND